MHARLRHRPATIALALGLALLLTGLETRAQESAPAPGETPAALTTGDPGISRDQLQLILTPLTRDEVLVETEAWRALLKATLEEIVEAEILAAGLAGEELAKAQIHIDELHEEKARRLRRFRVASIELAEKGGDSTEFDQYAKAVATIRMEVGNARVLWSMLRGWLRSPEGGILWLQGLGGFLGIVFGFYLLSAVLGRLVERATRRSDGLSHLLRSFLNRFVRRAILLLGIVVGLSQLGLNMGALAAVVGGSAIAIGFALQDSLSNFVSGIMLLAYRPFDIGHVVDVGGVSGKVRSLNLVSTHIRTFDNKLVIVPNNKIWGDVIINATSTSERRVDLVFGIGYEDDIAKAQDILERLVEQHEKILDKPAPVIKVNELADSSVNFICRPWAKTGDYWDVYWDLTRQVKETFDAEGISIPYPQRDVHLHQASS